MSKGTTHRTVRVDDELWKPAKEAAAANGDSLSGLIREALRSYVEWRTNEAETKE